MIYILVCFLNLAGSIIIIFTFTSTFCFLFVLFYALFIAYASARLTSLLYALEYKTYICYCYDNASQREKVNSFSLSSDVH